MRLWSTVVTHDANRPRRQSARYGRTSSTFTATGSASRLRELLCVRGERVDLRAGPVAADRRHLPLALPQERRDPRGVGEQRVAAERRPDERLVEPVAL